jgi:hypothetical protein
MARRFVTTPGCSEGAQVELSFRLHLIESGDPSTGYVAAESQADFQK